MFAKIKSILYSEFHTLKGPTVVCQVPPQFLEDETFDSISDFIITDSKLAGKLITFNAFGSKFVSLPMCIDNPKYHRNQLLFNVTFVFDVNADPSCFQSTIRKLGNCLRNLEIETELLSNLSIRPKIQEIMDRVLSDLNEFGHCVMHVDDVHSINLIVQPNAGITARQILEHEVPIVIRQLQQSEIPDLCIRKVYSFIDGVMHVSQIARKADVGIELVKQSLHHLIYFGVVKMIDAFQYRNEYVATERIHNLHRDSKLLDQCLQYIAVNPLRRPHPIVVFRFLCNMDVQRPGSSLGFLCKMKDANSNDEMTTLRPDDYGIDERRLIAFARAHGMLRRIHRYPVGAASSFEDNAISRWADGEHSLDWIASYEERSVANIESVLRSSTLMIDKIQPDT